jgi:hypothetical protein
MIRYRSVRYPILKFNTSAGNKFLQRYKSYLGTKLNFFVCLKNRREISKELFTAVLGIRIWSDSDLFVGSGSDPHKMLRKSNFSHKNFPYLSFSANHEKKLRTFNHPYLKQRLFEQFSKSGNFYSLWSDLDPGSVFFRGRIRIWPKWIGYANTASQLLCYSGSASAGAASF